MAAEQATIASKPVEIRPGVQRVLLGETAFEISTRYQLRKPIGHGAYGELPAQVSTKFEITTDFFAGVVV